MTAPATSPSRAARETFSHRSVGLLGLVLAAACICGPIGALATEPAETTGSTEVEVAPEPTETEVARAPKGEEIDPEDFGREGTYMGASFVFGIEEFSDTGPVGVENGLGFSLWLGQRLNEHFSIEAQWEWIDDFGDDFATGGSDPDVDFETNMFTVNGRGYLTTGRVQPFLKAGLGFIHAEVDIAGFDTDDDAFVIRGGAGIEIYLTPNLVLVPRAEYIFPTDDIQGLDYPYISTALGLQYRF